MLATYVANGNGLLATYEGSGSPGGPGPPAAELDASAGAGPGAGGSAAGAAGGPLPEEAQSAARSALGSCASPADAGGHCTLTKLPRIPWRTSACAAAAGTHRAAPVDSSR